jgi:YbbR domain-containing protein
MKQILLHNWKIKLTCLVLAFVVWYVIQHNVDPGDEGRGRGSASERAKK